MLIASENRQEPGNVEIPLAQYIIKLLNNVQFHIVCTK